MLAQGWTATAIQEEYGVKRDTVKYWNQTYQKTGIEGLKRRQFTHFSKEFKEKVVLEYIHDKVSLSFLRDKYDISNIGVIYSWYKRYTSGNKLTATRSRIHMNKGRTTSLEERIEIVNWTTAHDNDYTGAMAKFNVSYGQVYNWVRKFKQSGTDGLVDRRGIGKTEADSLTAEEKKDLEIKRLKEQVEYLSTENNVLKKLKEIERRDAKKKNIVPFKRSPKK
nr:helix-turn-helix domain-containing protein [Lentilactobacillus sp. Marseille-Q4993]